MRAPHVTELAGVDAAVYGIPFDTATSYRTGARFGPEAIRSASALIRPYHPVHDINVVEALSIVDYGDLPVSPGDTERTYAQVEEALEPIVAADVFPIALGGDHSITLAELRVLAKRHGPLALVLLDAHADTWEAYFGQKYFHGTTFKRAVEEGLLDATASVLAGMRGSVYAASDLGTARELGFTVVESDDLRALGSERYGELIREKVGERPVFMSFDIDFLDPAFAPGTGTPEVAGFSTAEAVAFSARLARDQPRRLRRRRGRARLRWGRTANRARGRERRLRATRAAGAQAAAVAADFSSSPNFARRTNCPTPGSATSSSPSTRIWPRSNTISGVPVTSVPS